MERYTYFQRDTYISREIHLGDPAIRQSWCRHRSLPLKYLQKQLCRHSIASPSLSPSLGSCSRYCQKKTSPYFMCKTLTDFTVATLTLYCLLAHGSVLPCLWWIETQLFLELFTLSLRYMPRHRVRDLVSRIKLKIMRIFQQYTCFF